MAPAKRIVKACNALKRYDISEHRVKDALEELLKLYENHWHLIEDDNYRVVLDFVLEKKEEDKKADPKKKGASSSRGVKRVKRKLQLIDESDDDEEFEPSRKMACLNGKDLASISEDSSNQLVEETISGRTQQDDADQLIKTQQRPVSLTEHIVLKSREPDSPQTCSMQGKTDTSSSFLGNNRAKPNCERGTGVAHIIEMEIEHCSDYIDTENVPGKNGSDNLDVAKSRAELVGFNQPGDEAPLTVITLAEVSQSQKSVQNCSITKAGDLCIHKSKTSYMDDGDNPVSKTLNYDIASSSEGEVKISLIYNSSLRPGFQVPCLDTVLKMVEDKFLISGIFVEPHLMMKVMKELCECYREMANSVNSEKIGTLIAIPKLEITKQCFAQNDQRREDYQGSILPVFSNGLVRIQNLIVVLQQMPKVVVRNDFSNLHFVSGFNIKDILNFCKDSEKKVKLLRTSLAPSSSYHTEVIEEQHSSHEVVKSWGYVEDITRGEEKRKISLVSGGKREDSPNFTYIATNAVYRKAYVNFSLARISDEDCCSDCFGDCLSSAIPCACSRETGGRFAYTQAGLVREDFLKECISIKSNPKDHHYVYCEKCPLESSTCKGHLVRKFIKECWARCGCNKKCGNRIVQQGIAADLQVFFTSQGKGWGLRALEDLQKGAFVCEYVGEILTNSELYERNVQSTGREKHTYPTLLDADWGSEGFLKDEDALCLDATLYGNVARFINHRCNDANLIDIPVEVETPDHHYYHVAFFTTRKVKAMEELTWDYGIDFDDHEHPIKAFECLCRSRLCRGKKRSKICKMNHDSCTGKSKTEY